jgi:hypothetical protein
MAAALGAVLVAVVSKALSGYNERLRVPPVLRCVAVDPHAVSATFACETVRNYQPYTPSGADYGRPAEQKVTFETRHAPLAQRTDSAWYCRGIHHRRNPLASPHQPNRVLPWPQGAKNQIRSVTSRYKYWPALILRAFLLVPDLPFLPVTAAASLSGSP